MSEKYRNPDKRCGYPWDDSPVGYCWSYAHHVDGNKVFADMSKICPGCDLYVPQLEEAGQQPATPQGQHADADTSAIA